MKRLLILLGMVKCAFTPAIMVLAVCSATTQNEVTLPAPTAPHQTTLL